ncbi:MAG: proline dehydrogenase family protein [Halobacteriaceae archaeon]
MIPPIASRFVAGESPAAVLDHTREINERGVGGILNLLGEHYEERGPADEDADAYVDLIDDIADSGLDACVSVKPSQLGLDVDRSVFDENLDRVVDHGAERGVFVWIDMEDHTTTDATLDAYERTVTDHGGGVGVCVQANLKRTADDLDRLADLPGKVRLVKGAYDEPEDVAYQQKDRVNESYRELLTQMFRTFDGGVGVGSHDPEMIELAVDLHEKHGTDFEVQMLMGVRESAQFDLADDHEVWQYVPYGDKWLSYFYRRVMERTENLTFALRAVVGR